MDAHLDPALAAANQAFSSKRRQHATRIASVEPHALDRSADAWETAAMITVAVATVLSVVGLWCL